MVSIARLAQVAQVATVATVTVAQPARVARVATVAQPNTGAQIQGPKLAPLAAGGTPSQYAGSQGDQQSGANSGERGKEKGGSDGSGYGALDAAFLMREQPSAHFALHGVTAATGSSSAERAQRILAAMEDAPARPLSQITMNVDAGNGNTDRIQVGLRGSSLNATIDTVDIGGAHAMNARSDELVRALSRDGVEVESLRVRATSTANAPLAPQSSRGSSDSSNGARSERGNPWQQHEKQQSENDRRQQQRDKRGGNTQ